MLLLRNRKILVFVLFSLLPIGISGPVFAQEAEQEVQKDPAMERQLLMLAKTGFPGPVVVALDASGKRPEAPEAAPITLKNIASNFGLKVFEEDEVYVIGPEKRLDFTGLFGDTALTMLSDPLDLVYSLTDEQFRQLGSQQGLQFSVLETNQQRVLASMFAPGNLVTKGDDTTNGYDHGPAIPGETLPLQSARLRGWLDVSDVTVYFPNATWQSITSAEPAKTNLMLTTANTDEDVDFAPLVKLVPNTAKKSDLDYSDPALRKPVSFGGRVSLRDFIDRVAKETGVVLHASPGSDKVNLFVSASNVPAGRLLKSVSLASTGTWRRFGDAYIFAPDNAGLGQIAAREWKILGDLLTNWAGSTYLSARKLENLGLIAALPYAPNTSFVPSLEEVSYLLAGGNSDGPHLFWNQLSADQQSYLEQEMARAGRKEMQSPISERPWWKVGLTVKLNLSCTFPGMQPILLPVQEFGMIWTDVYAGPSGSQGLTVLPAEHIAHDIPAYRDAPAKLRIAIEKPVRGYMCRPSPRETPDELISLLTKRGFNTLYLRVFSDGYAAFESAQFPKAPDLDKDYLLKVISKAHERGIRVFGVVDVLRWSDGSKGSWVSKRPELLDYDILGRTHAELGREFAQWISSQPDVMASDCRLEVAQCGEGLTGDAVTPSSPEVKTKLLGLLDELAKYEFDGLMLDYTTMRHVRPRSFSNWEPVYWTEGRPGHSPLARQEFFRAHEADSVDVVADEGLSLECPPLQPIVIACEDLGTVWDEFYRKGCDDLLEALVKSWHREDGNPQSQIRNPKSPVWVLATFRASTESHDWARFKDLVDGIVISGAGFTEADAVPEGFKTTPIVRASDSVGTLTFASTLASGLGMEFEGIAESFKPEKPWESDGVIVDMTSAGRKKSDYLRLIAPPAENR